MAVNSNTKGEIAYLEDDPLQSARVSSWLNDHGYRCRAYSDVDAIQGAFDSHQFDAALLDWHLDTGGSGMDVLAHLRANQRSDLPVVFLSSKNSTKDISTVLNAGADDFLAKPVARKDLLNVLGAYLRGDSVRVGVIEYEPYKDDTINEQWLLSGECLELTACDYALASYLFGHAEQTVSNAVLQGIVEEVMVEGDVKRIESSVHEMKKAIRLRETGQWHLDTVHGYGYRLTKIGELLFAA